MKKTQFKTDIHQIFLLTKRNFSDWGKNPRIWIPPTVASAILGPIASAVFKLEGTKLGAGMGTSGLVGQFDAISVMGSSPRVIMIIVLMHVILPAILTLLISEFMRKKGYIKFGDMKL